MTWAEFKTAVRVYLTVDGNRINIQDYLDRAILATVIDIQSFVPHYRVHSSTTYSRNGTIRDSEPLADDQKASVGALEGDVRITDAYFVDGTEDYDWQDDISESADSNCECYRAPLTTWPWANRHDLLCGMATDNHAMSIHPNGINFIVFPQVTSTDKVEIFYQSIKRAVTDADVIPFGDEEVVQAVAEGVKARLAREIDRDLAMHKSYFLDYQKLRQRIYLDTRDRKRILWSTPSPMSDAASRQSTPACDTTSTSSTTTLTNNC